MRFVILFALLLITGTNAPAQQALSFDGYYVSVPDSSNFSPFRYYLRFYPDGGVIGVNTAGKPENLLAWFKKENPTPYKGKFKMTDSTLQFSMVSEQGEVVYNGKLTGDNRLELLVKSLINKYEGMEAYHFMKMEKIK